MPTRDRSRAGSSVRISDETKKQLKRIVKRTGRTQPEIFKTLIDMADVHDLLRKDWQERLNASLRRGMWQLQLEAHQANKERCDSLRGSDEKWKCIVGRKNKTPMIRILAEDNSDALNLCEGCEITKARIAETEGLRDEVLELQTKLKQRADIVYRVPVCMAGGILTGDGSGFTRCPKKRAGAVDVEKFCKIRNQKKGCEFYKEVVVGVGAKINVKK